MLQYNLTVEHQLPWGVGGTLSYAGTRGFNLLRTREGNPRIPQILSDGGKSFLVGAPRVNRNFGSIELKAADSNSWYNSLQFSVNKRLSNRLQFQSSYTWAHVLDEWKRRFVLFFLFFEACSRLARPFTWRTSHCATLIRQ